MRTPSPNGPNGRDVQGRFAMGNPGGPGNPHAGAVGRWRVMLAETITAEDIRAVLNVLLDRAKAGERWAVCELLDRCLGKSEQPTTASAGELQVCRIHLEVDEGPMRVSGDDA